MSRIVGIDLGTTNSLIAAVDAGIPYVVADSEGQRLTPSVVHYASDGAPALVGRQAQRLRILKPAETVYSIKRLIGRRGGEVAAEKNRLTYAVTGPENSPARVEMHGRAFTPGRNFRRNPQEAPARCGSRLGRTHHSRRHYRAGLLQ